MIKYTVEEKLERISPQFKKKHDPEHIIFILDRVLTKLRKPKYAEEEF